MVMAAASENENESVNEVTESHGQTEKGDPSLFEADEEEKGGFSSPSPAQGSNGKESDLEAAEILRSLVSHNKTGQKIEPVPVDRNGTTDAAKEEVTAGVATATTPDPKERQTNPKSVVETPFGSPKPAPRQSRLDKASPSSDLGDETQKYTVYGIFFT